MSQFPKAEDEVEGRQARDEGENHESAAPTPGGSGVVDPNVIAPPDEDAGGEPAIEAAVASLASDSELAAKERAARPEASSSRELPQSAFGPPDDEPLELDDPRPARAPAPEAAGADTHQKVSELTLLGAEEMLRRAEHGGGTFKRIALVVLLLAGLGGLSYWLYQRSGSFESMPRTAQDIAQTRVVEPIEDSMAPDDRFTIRGLKLAIQTPGWKPDGKESSVQTPTSLEIRQTYAHDGMHVHTRILAFDKRKTARKYLETVDPPSKALLFDSKVVVLQPATPDDAFGVDTLADVLHSFHKNVLDAHKD